MKREELKEILKSRNPTDEEINSIMALHGAGITAIKDTLNGNIEKLTAQLSERDKDIADLKKSAGDNAELQKKFDELQGKYETETEKFKAEIASRDFKDAMRSHIAEKNIKFSSKAAESYFYSEAEKKAMKNENGKLIGFDDFYKSQLEADKGAFVVESDKGSNSNGKHAPEANKGNLHFLGGTGSSGGSTSMAALMAQKWNAQFSTSAPNTQAANNNQM